MPELGGFWQGVTGAPEPGETDEEAAIREVREETGFGVVVEALGFRYDLRPSWEGPEQWHAMYGPGVEAIPEETFATEVAFGSEPVLSPREHDAFRWCSFDEADSLLKWNENREALGVLRERLGN